MEDYKWKTAVITLSDKGYRGEREDKDVYKRQIDWLTMDILRYNLNLS